MSGDTGKKLILEWSPEDFVLPADQFETVDEAVERIVQEDQCFDGFSRDSIIARFTKTGEFDAEGREKLTDGVAVANLIGGIRPGDVETAMSKVGPGARPTPS